MKTLSSHPQEVREGFYSRDRTCSVERFVALCARVMLVILS